MPYHLIAIALAPGIAIMVFIYLKDRHEPEPIWLLLLSFILGCLSPFITLFLSFLTLPFFSQGNHSVWESFLYATLGVGLVEEFSKFIFVRFFIFYRKDFNEPFDGIVYAVIVSMGFATVENVMYVLKDGLETGVWRMFTAVPAHGSFAVVMGFFLGMAKFRRKYSILLSFIALAGASLLHGAYDFFLFIYWVPGMYIGAFVSLILGLLLSIQAIRLHQMISPFSKEHF